MANMIPISTVTVGSGGAASIDFTSIPATYTDLLIMLSARGSASAVNTSTFLYPNGSSSSMTAKRLYGSGSSAASDSNTRIEIDGATATSSTFGNTMIYIPNYNSSNYKSISIDSVLETNATTAYQLLQAALWSNTAAITSLQLSAESPNTFSQYSTATLYGIRKY